MWLQVARTLNERISKYTVVTLDSCAYAGTSDVLKVQQLLAQAGEHLEVEEGGAWKVGPRCRCWRCLRHGSSVHASATARGNIVSYPLNGLRHGGFTSNDATRSPWTLLSSLTQQAEAQQLCPAVCLSWLEPMLSRKQCLYIAAGHAPERSCDGHWAGGHGRGPRVSNGR